MPSGCATMVCLYDAWLRVHVRAGGRILKVCPQSMIIPGTLAQWREWTGLPFDTDGPVIVQGALSPVLVSLSQNVAVYAEPNVWVEHRKPNRACSLSFTV